MASPPGLWTFLTEKRWFEYLTFSTLGLTYSYLLYLKAQCNIFIPLPFDGFFEGLMKVIDMGLQDGNWSVVNNADKLQNSGPQAAWLPPFRRPDDSGGFSSSVVEVKAPDRRVPGFHRMEIQSRRETGSKLRIGVDLSFLASGDIGRLAEPAPGKRRRSCPGPPFIAVLENIWYALLTGKAGVRGALLETFYMAFITAGFIIITFCTALSSRAQSKQDSVKTYQNRRFISLIACVSLLRLD